MISATSITMAVREPVASAPSTSTTAPTHQRRLPVRAKYTAIGRIMISAAPRAIGCCAGPKTRRLPPRSSSTVGPTRLRNGTTESTWSNAL